jgi:putative ABC transport system permease protein
MAVMRHDLRFALRMLISHRWFSLAVVATLALGIGLNTMVFTLIYAVLFKPVPVPGGERLVSIISRNTTMSEGFLPMSYPDFQDFRAQATSFEALEAGTDQGGIISENGQPPQGYHLLRASSGIFSMLHTAPILGRAFVAADDKPGADSVLVLGYGVWKDRYGSARDVIGRQVHVDGLPATIIGVMPIGFKFPSGVDIYMPLVPNPELAKRDNRRVFMYGILKHGVSLQQASGELDAIAARLAKQYPVADKDIGVVVQTFHQRYNGGPIRVIFLLMLAAVGFVLVIACADVANMMLSRALLRRREISIRTALGASRWRVIRQLLVECVLLSSLGGLAGLGLAAIGVHWFDLSTQRVRPSWISFSMDYSVFGYFAALCIVSGLLFGIMPALRSSRPDLNEVLKEGARSAGRRREGWSSAVLVVSQFALTLVLLTGAGIFVRSLLNNLTINPEIPAEHLMTGRIDLPDARYKDADTRQRFFDQLVPRLRAIPGVSHAAVAFIPPGLGAARKQIELEHAPIAEAARRPWVSFIAQSPGYFETIHLPLVSGRDFNQLDGAPEHESAVLTRDTAARFWPNQDPIGKRFRLYDDQNKPTAWITVVGVSANLVQEVVTDEPRPMLFVPYRQEGLSSMTLVVDSANDPSAAARSAVQSLDPELPLRDGASLSKALDDQTWFLRLFGKLFGSFAFIGLVMASVGIYAVIAQASSSRTQEIGVRMALGAGVRDILMLVMRRGLWQIAVGLALGLGLAIPAARLLKALPIGISTSDPAVFLAVAAVLVGVGVFAVWLPARRAASLDPVQAIRYE